MQQLIAGVKRFQTEVFPQKRDLFARLASGQRPPVMFITCADSRVHPSLITQSDPGDLFISRNAGNLVPSYGAMGGGEAATVEYAVKALKVEHIVVCGHTDCGAMKALLQPEILTGFPAVADWLRHAHSAKSVVEQNGQAGTPESTLRALIEENALTQLRNLETHPCVAGAVSSGKLQLHAWIYEIATGHILAHDRSLRRFTPLVQEEAVSA